MKKFAFATAAVLYALCAAPESARAQETAVPYVFNMATKENKLYVYLANTIGSSTPQSFGENEVAIFTQAYLDEIQVNNYLQSAEAGRPTAMNVLEEQILLEYQEIIQLARANNQVAVMLAVDNLTKSYLSMDAQIAFETQGAPNEIYQSWILSATAMSGVESYIYRHTY